MDFVGPFYEIILSSKWDSGRRETLEAYVLDRIPQGPLKDFVELQDGSTACDPCNVSPYSNSRNKPLRYLIRLPDIVKNRYNSHFRSDYVNTYTLPGFMTWLYEYGYKIADVHHILPDHHSGFWITFAESTTDEFKK